MNKFNLLQTIFHIVILRSKLTGQILCSSLVEEYCSNLSLSNRNFTVKDKNDVHHKYPFDYNDDAGHIGMFLQQKGYQDIYEEIWGEINILSTESIEIQIENIIKK